MWLREPLPIEVSRVASVPIGGQFWDEVNDAPLDVTGYSFTISVAKEDGEFPITTAAVAIINAPLGMVDFIINGTSYASQAGPKESIILSYQVKAIEPSGNSVIALRGPLILTPGI